MAYQVTMTGTTANATIKEIYQADGTRFLIAAGASYRIEGIAIAQNTSTIASKEWEFDILIKNVAGVTSFVGYPTCTPISGDTGTDDWTLTLDDDDTNDALSVKVTGVLATTISWKVEFNYTSIGYTPSVEAASSSLNVPQLVELIKVHSPKTPDSMIVKMLGTAQKRFIRKTKLNIETSTVSLVSQSVTGYTLASPLTLTDTASDYTWSFYKDATVNTLTMKSNSNVILYTGIYTIDSAGELCDVYSAVFNADGSISFYDDEYDELTNFDDDAYYIVFEFVKTPDTLTNVNTSTPEIQSDFHEALSAWVIAELYMARTDMQMIERLQASKHYKNLYDEFVFQARCAYNLNGNTFPISMLQSGDFQED